MPIVSLIGKTLKWFINDTDLSDKNHCKYYYSIINHNVAQWLISQTLHSDVLKPLFKDFIANNSLIYSATFFGFTKYNITSEKRYRKSMKFNVISINSNFWKHDSEEINLVGLSSTYSKTKYEIKLSSAINGFIHTDKFM